MTTDSPIDVESQSYMTEELDLFRLTNFFRQQTEEEL